MTSQSSSSNRDKNVVSSSKNTRKRIQQKRTRNKTGGGASELKKNENKPTPSPVIESSNPFFIAVCSPESYKPVVSANHKNGNSDVGRRRYNEPAHNSIRTKPNVFLRQPSRNSSYETSGSGSGSASSHPNQFIHHPRLQNERHMAVVPVVHHNVNVPEVTTNIHDTEQFPTLSSGSAVLNTSKLNFKEMVLKNTTTATATTTTTTTTSSPLHVPPPTKNSLSSGNIFLSAFYGPSHDDGDDGDDGYDGGGVSSSPISSVLVDSCDRKYDNLYKY